MEEAMYGIEDTDESADYSENNGRETINDDGIKIEEYCLTNPWAAGKEKMEKVNYLNVKRAKNERNVRKRVVS